MTRPIIEVRDLGKRYRLGAIGMTSLREEIERWSRRLRHGADRTQPRGDFWALRDVSFDVRPGEVVGIIGRNGAGKSTLLKILSRITRQTTGRVTLRGRVASLLEVGTGFHPELSGRDNIFLNGAILGMSTTEIRRKFDEIVAFAEVDAFLDTPVKRYSSGMYVRLAFAVAAHLEPEILIVDEVLAVGDADFQRKCLGRMGQVARHGRTVLFVSHNLRAIVELCERSLWIDHGRILQDGPSTRIVQDYLRSDVAEREHGRITDDMHRNATGDVLFRRITLIDRKGRSTNSLSFGARVRFKVELHVHRAVQNARVILAIERVDGTLVTVFHHTDDPVNELLDLWSGIYEIDVDVDLALTPGAYVVELGVKPAPGYRGSGMSWDWVPQALTFQVEEFDATGATPIPVSGVVRPLPTWGFARVGEEAAAR